MTTQTLSATDRNFIFLLSEANGNRSRDTVTLASGQDLGPGTVLGKLTRDTIDVAADGDNTGAAVVTAATVTLGANAQAGTYTLTCTTAGSTGGGVFQVQAPDGQLIAPLTAGAAYSSSHISLTIPAGDGSGTADWALGDLVTIAVSGGGEYSQFDQDATDGSQVAGGILVQATDASGGDRDAVIIARDAEVSASHLVWPADITDGETATAVAALAALGIIVRS